MWTFVSQSRRLYIMKSNAAWPRLPSQFIHLGKCFLLMWRIEYAHTQYKSPIDFHMHTLHPSRSNVWKVSLPNSIYHKLGTRINGIPMVTLQMATVYILHLKHDVLYVQTVHKFCVLCRCRLPSRCLATCLRKSSLFSTKCSSYCFGACVCMCSNCLLFTVVDHLLLTWYRCMSN